MDKEGFGLALIDQLFHKPNLGHYRKSIMEVKQKSGLTLLSRHGRAKSATGECRRHFVYVFASMVSIASSIVQRVSCRSRTGNDGSLRQRISFAHNLFNANPRNIR